MKTRIFKEVEQYIIDPLPPSPGHHPHLRRRCTAPGHRHLLGWQGVAGTLGTERAATATPRPSQSCRHHLRTPLRLLLPHRTHPCRPSLVVVAAELTSLRVAIVAASISGAVAASAWSSPAFPPLLVHRRPHHPVGHHPGLPHLRRRPHRSRQCAGPASCATAAADAASGGHLPPRHLHRPYLPLAGSPRWAQLPSCGGSCPEVLEDLLPLPLLLLRRHLHLHPSLVAATAAIAVASTLEASADPTVQDHLSRLAGGGSLGSRR